MTVVGEFTNFAHWVNKASSRIGGRGAVCTDAKGRVLTIGAHFMRARDEGAFPVRYEYEAEAEEGTRFDMRRMVRKPAREFACIQTSGSGKLACAGLDGGPHSDVCDLLTSAIEEDRGESRS